MTPDRRALLQAGSAAGLQAALAALGLLPAGPAAAQSFADAVFQAKSTADALKALGVAEENVELKKPEATQGSGSNAEARRVEVILAP